MRSAFTLCSLLALSPVGAASAETAASAPAATIAAAAPVEHPNPRLKLSYRRFAVAGFDAATIPFDGVQLDAYPLSRRWVRVGLEAEAGSGGATWDGASTKLWCALAGLSAGLQYPARVTPFIEGRVAAGALGGDVTGSATYGGATLTMHQAVATLIYLGGVEAGIELYAVGRTFVSVSVGWAHPVYFAPNQPSVQAPMSAAAAMLLMAPHAADTFTFKVGVGL